MQRVDHETPDWYLKLIAASYAAELEREKPTVAERVNMSSWSLPAPASLERNFELPPEDTYTFKLVKIGDPVENTYDPAKERRPWEFMIADDGQVDASLIGVTVREFFTMSSHPKSNLYPFVKALCGGAIDPNEEWGPAMVEGKLMKATLTHKQSQSDPSKSYARLSSPLPFRGTLGNRKGPAVTNMVSVPVRDMGTQEVPF